MPLPLTLIEAVDAPKFDRLPAGPPTILMRGKHLRLSTHPPLAADRGAIALQAGSAYDSEVLEYRIVDLESGAVKASLEGLSSVYPRLGVAVGRSRVGDASWRVLVHGDGLLVPLWPLNEDDAHDLVIHPGTGEAWVFEEHDDPAGDVDTQYAAWSNLRAPPPKPSKPFPGLLVESDTGVRPRGRLGPDMRDPVPLPLFVDVYSTQDGCKKVELERDGVDCRTRGHLALAGGWRVDSWIDGDAVRASSSSTGRVEALALGDDCEIVAATLDPARVWITCRDESSVHYIWTPERTYRVPDGVLGGFTTWGHNGHLVEIRAAEANTEPHDSHWIDMVGMRALRHPAVDPLSIYAADRLSVVEDSRGDGRVLAIEIDTAVAYDLPLHTKGCARVDVPAVSFPWVAVGCYDRAERLRSLELVDLEHHRIWTLPVLREMWLQPERSRVVGVIAKGRHTSVVAWNLKSP